MPADSPPGSPRSSPAEDGAAVARRAPPDPDTLPPDYLALVSVIVAIAAVYLGVHVLAWGALACLGVAAATKTADDFDVLNMSISFTVVVAALLATR